MHDSLLSDESERCRLDDGPWVKKRRRRKPPVIGELEALFVLLAKIRAANADSLFTLFFAKHGTPRRTAMRRLAWLVAGGYLAHRRLFDSTRAIYFLTAKTLRAFPSVRTRAVTDTVRQPPPPRQAAFCWLRAMIFAALVGDGFTIGRGSTEQSFLRRRLVDEQVARVEAMNARARSAFDREAVFAADVLKKLRRSPLLTPLFRNRCGSCGWTGAPSEAVSACPRCKRATEARVSDLFFRCADCGFVSDEASVHRRADGKGRCSGTMVLADPLPFDVAWRSVGGKVELFIVLVDDPSRAIEAQFRDLPIDVEGQPHLPLLVRSADLDSVYDATARKWAAMGARHAVLMRDLNPHGRCSWFASRVELIDYRPDLQLHILH